MLGSKDHIPKGKTFWDGRGGKEGTPGEVLAENISATAEAVRYLRDGLDVLASSLAEVESLLDRAGQTLNLSQPPMNNRYGLRWWFLRPDVNGYTRYREPVVVQWVKKRGAKAATPIRMQRLRAHSHGAFALNHKEAEATLGIIRSGIARREKIKADMIALRRILNGLRVNAYSLGTGNDAARLDVIRAGVIRNLLEAGYEIEPHLTESLQDDGP